MGETILTYAHDDKKWIFGNEHGRCRHGIPFFGRSSTQKGNGTGESSPAQILSLISMRSSFFVVENFNVNLRYSLSAEFPSSKEVMIDGNRSRASLWSDQSHSSDRFWLVVESRNWRHDNPPILVTLTLNQDDLMQRSFRTKSIVSPLFYVTSASLTRRLWLYEWAIAERLLIEQGATIIPSTLKEPLARLAPDPLCRDIGAIDWAV